MSAMRLGLAWLVMVLTVLSVPPAHAQGDVSTGGRPQPRCQQHCFVISSFSLLGDLEQQPLSFRVEGIVLADDPQAVPLFGPPKRVRIEGAKVGARDAVIGFNDDHYLLHVERGRFVLEGKLSLNDDWSLELPGPINIVDTSVSSGRVVEGTQLSGVKGITLHFERGAAQTTKPSPTVFQLARAFRVTKQTEFEYHLDVRSGVDVGVVELPLKYGEKVLEVAGSEGWRIDGERLLLPTTGRKAKVTIAGTLPKLRKFEPEARSRYEWWLFESDPEHRLLIQTDARQVDVGESPIEPQLSNARLYFVDGGKSAEPRVQLLESTEVLAAIVRQQSRKVFITSRGDAVFDDELRYENNGVDYLAFAPRGRPIFLATDGRAERIMRMEGKTEELMVPLHTGEHTARVQSVHQARLSWWGGRLEVPMASHSLTASSASVTLGIPKYVVPIAVLGGDEPSFLVNWGDLFGILVGVAFAWAALRGSWRWLLAAAALGGFWFAVPGLYFVVVFVLGTVGVTRFFSRYLSGHTLFGLAVAAAGGCAILTLAVSMMFTVGASERTASQAAYDEYGSRDHPTAVVKQKYESPKGGLVEGVTPVALPLPPFERTVHVKRNLVTQDRPFVPVVYYAGGWTYLAVTTLWALLAALVLYGERRRLQEVYDWGKSLLYEVLGPAKKQSKAASEESSDPDTPSPDVRGEEGPGTAKS